MRTVSPEQVDQAHELVARGLRLALALRARRVGDLAKALGHGRTNKVRDHLAGRRLPKAEELERYAKEMGLPVVMIHVMGAIDWDKLGWLFTTTKRRKR